MKISTAWVREFTNITLENDELIRRIGAQLGAIESVEDWGAYYDDKIVISEIVEAKNHPDADRLGVYTISVGNSETRTLVAGDKTLTVGDKVAYIPPSVAVPQSLKDSNFSEPFIITEREIRGVKSQGMLGSAKELIFSSDHEGVVKLDGDLVVGTSLKMAYSLDDCIIDVENKMFTHRPDLFGILGLAREIAGIQESNFESPEWYTQAHKDVYQQEITNSLQLSIGDIDSKLSPRFTAAAFSNVTVKPSPMKMQSMLTRVGLKPINNIVDITNFVMYLTAQPLHAFDYDKVVERTKQDGAHLTVRYANPKETLALLDGRTVELSQDAVVVATDKEALSIAGCIGGADTEVSVSTKNVILEVANWDLYAIRRTSFDYGLFTDAVTRYSKGQSVAQCRIASAKAAELFFEHASATQASKLLDTNPAIKEQPTILVSAEFINQRLGSKLSSQEIATVLKRTEFGVDITDDVLEVKVPFWRTDIIRKEDIVEEVGRLIGFDNLPIELPFRVLSPANQSDEIAQKIRIRNILSAFGAHEVLTYSFVSEQLLEQTGVDKNTIDSLLRIRNSISPELEVMRPALLPSLISKLQANIKSGYKEFALFEVNKVHNKVELVEDDLPKERNVISFVYVMPGRSNNGEAYYLGKRYLEALFDEFSVETDIRLVESEDMPWQSSVIASMDLNRSAHVLANDKTVGYVGEVRASVLHNFKIRNSSVAAFEIDMSSLPLDQMGAYKPLSKFPSSTQDVTFEVPDALSYANLIQSVDEHLKIDASVSHQPISIYRQTKDQKRKITLQFSFVSQNRTLKTAEINTAIENLFKALAGSDVTQA